MSTSPADNPVPGVVTFTARGSAALDQLADALVAECDGSPASIADLLERVLAADNEDLAETLIETAKPTTGREELQELGPAPESPDDAARRRLSTRAPFTGGNPGAQPRAGISADPR